MAAIKARFEFNPAVPGVNFANPLTVEGESLSEVKQKVKDQLAAKASAAQGQLDAINAANAAVDS